LHIAAITLAGIVLRIYVLQSPIGGFDADEATSSLVSRQVLDGNFPAFIRPLHHGGTLLAYPRAPFLALFGPSPVMMKVTEMLVYAAACLVTWRLGRRIFSEVAAQLGAGVMWVYPPATVWESTKVMLYYTPAVLLAVLAMLLVIRLYQEDRRNDLWWLGLVLGLAVWTHPIALYAAVPACAWLVVHRPRIVREVWRAVPTGLIGVFPWLWANLHNSWGSLEQPTGTAKSTFWARLTGFFEALLPRLAGLRGQYLGGWYLAPLSGVVYAALMVAALVAVRRWKGERTLLLTVAIAYPFMFSVPRNSVFVDEPRYGMALLPVLALCVGFGIERLLRWRVLAVGAVGVLALLSLVSLRHVVVQTAGRPGLDVLRPVDTGELWQSLRDEHIDGAYVDYWIGMRLQFEQKQPFTFLPVNSYYLDYRYSAPPAGSRYAVFAEGSPLADRWIEFVGARGLTTEVRATEHFVIITTDQPVPFAVTLGVLE
jgi:4-amino-4-deoxy-L-arabinose transferase-like glycosyltransferase